MAIARKPHQKALDPHRLEMIRLGREVNDRAGIVREPGLTAEELQGRMLAEGIRPEDNIGSRELMRMRYGDDWEEE
jgi:hypothetical protein